MPIICRCLMGHRRLVNASGQPEIIAALFILINGIITLGHLCAQLQAVGCSWASVGRQLGVVGRQLGVVGACTGAYVSFLVNEKTNLIALMQDAYFGIYICILL